MGPVGGEHRGCAVEAEVGGRPRHVAAALGPGSERSRHEDPDARAVGRLEEVVQRGLWCITDPLRNVMWRPALSDGGDGVEIDHPIAVRSTTSW